VPRFKCNPLHSIKRREKWSGPGSSVGPGDDIMGGDGYHNPAYGIGDIPGGTFVGLDRFHAACSIPNDLQPSIPPGGLLGPDGVIPFDRVPGYRPPSDWTGPWHVIPMPKEPDPGTPIPLGASSMIARPPELVPGEGFVPGSSDGGFSGGGGGRDGSMPQPEMMGGESNMIARLPGSPGEFEPPKGPWRDPREKFDSMKPEMMGASSGNKPGGSKKKPRPGQSGGKKPSGGNGSGGKTGDDSGFGLLSSNKERNQLTDEERQERAARKQTPPYSPTYSEHMGSDVWKWLKLHLTREEYHDLVFTILPRYHTEVWQAHIHEYRRGEHCRAWAEVGDDLIRLFGGPNWSSDIKHTLIRGHWWIEITSEESDITLRIDPQRAGNPLGFGGNWIFTGPSEDFHALWEKDLRWEMSDYIPGSNIHI